MWCAACVRSSVCVCENEMPLLFSFLLSCFILIGVIVFMACNWCETSDKENNKKSWVNQITKKRRKKTTKKSKSYLSINILLVYYLLGVWMSHSLYSLEARHTKKAYGAVWRVWTVLLWVLPSWGPHFLCAVFYWYPANQLVSEYFLVKPIFSLENI